MQTRMNICDMYMLVHFIIWFKSVLEIIKGVVLWCSLTEYLVQKTKQCSSKGGGHVSCRLPGIVNTFSAHRMLGLKVQSKYIYTPEV